MNVLKSIQNGFVSIFEGMASIFGAVFEPATTTYVYEYDDEGTHTRYEYVVIGDPESALKRDWARVGEDLDATFGHIDRAFAHIDDALKSHEELVNANGPSEVAAARARLNTARRDIQKSMDAAFERLRRR